MSSDNFPHPATELRRGEWIDVSKWTIHDVAALSRALDFEAEYIDWRSTEGSVSIRITPVGSA